MKGSKTMLNNSAKPILKWAGGKTQMLGDLLPKVPKSYGRLGCQAIYKVPLLSAYTLFLHFLFVKILKLTV